MNPVSITIQGLLYVKINKSGKKSAIYSLNTKKYNDTDTAPHFMKGQPMLKDHIWPLQALLPFELKQCMGEGRDTGAYADKIGSLSKLNAPPVEMERHAGDIMDGMAARPAAAGYAYAEPTELQDILDARLESGRGLRYDVSGMTGDVLYDKVYGAWLGRCAGCLLGQPVEFWERPRLIGLLKETGNWPIRQYISSDIPESIRGKYGVSDRGWNYGSSVVNWVNNVSCMPEDDDINYTILALKVLEENGAGFTAEDVALRWLMDLPVLHTFTAERIAYRNLLNGRFPPESGRYRNPCREWIGAQIRGDFFGYVNPGRPEAAAAMAYRDGTVSHTKNGIYGEMFVAAMLSAAAAGESAEGIVLCGLSQIPCGCRLAEAVHTVLGWKKQGLGWEQAIDGIHRLYDEKDAFDSLYVLPNAMIVCAGLLYGGLDFETSIGIAVAASFDRDCNGATVGSIVGMALGAGKLPSSWIGPLNDTVQSGVDSGAVRISDLATRTIAVFKKLEEQRN
jgi:ADP-ribosylglycohydrolase